MAPLKTRDEIATDFARRLLAYTDEITYLGGNSVGYAISRAVGESVENNGEALYRSLLRRFTLIGAAGEALDEVLEEHGVPRLGPARASTLVVLQPWAATVTAITGTRIEVDDATHFPAGASLRITSADGTVSEVLDVESVDTGTGPNGGDELVVGAIVGTYTPDTEVVSVLLRTTILAGTVVVSTTGVRFETLDDVTIGDRNPVLRGESTALALADKVFVEAITPGSDGRVDAFSLTAFEVPNADVRALTNPTAAEFGVDVEADLDAKWRAAHQGQLAAVETVARHEALARVGHRNVLRAFAGDSEAAGIVRLYVLTRTGLGLPPAARTALQRFLATRVRAGASVEVVNAQPTAVEVEATITLTPGAGTVRERLVAVYVAAAARLAAYADWRKWEEGEPVDDAMLLSLIRTTPGVGNVVVSTFSPSSDVAVDYVPRLARFVLTDQGSGQTYGAALTTEF